MDRRLAEIAKFLGITNTMDTEAIQGRGSYEDRTKMLRLIVDLVEASIIADNQEWSIDEQVAKDIQLIDSIAVKQSQIFSEECNLFPADVQIQSRYPLNNLMGLALSYQAFISGLKVRLLTVAAPKLGKHEYIGLEVR